MAVPLRKLLVLAGLFVMFPVGYTLALPDYLDMFNQDPMTRAKSDSCGLCHLNTDGGGGRNEFGEAFAADRYFSPLLRSWYPDTFIYPIFKSGDTTFYFSDPSKKQIVIESGGKRVVVDIPAQTVNGVKAKATP